MDKKCKHRRLSKSSIRHESGPKLIKERCSDCYQLINEYYIHSKQK
jgi:hypothetical protein